MIQRYEHSWFAIFSHGTEKIVGTMIRIHWFQLTVRYPLDDLRRDPRYLSLPILVRNPRSKNCLVSILQSIGTGTELLLHIDRKDVPPTSSL